MKRPQKNPFYFLCSLFLILQIAHIQGQEVDDPFWLQNGVFAKYEFKSPGIFFLNGTFLAFDNDYASVTWLWKCTKIDENIATLNVSMKIIEESSSSFISNEVVVNTTSRQVFSSNGTLIGTTNLWALANPEEGAEIIVWDNPPDRIVGDAKIQGCSITPQGAQKIYIVEGNGSSNGKPSSTLRFYDKDTGIMIGGFIDTEAALLALDIEKPLINGRFLFTDTNIDLGPRELLSEILSLLPVLLIIAPFILVFVIVYKIRKNKRKKGKKNKKERFLFFGLKHN